MGKVQKRLFIGNIPPSADQKSLKKHLKDLGKILSVSINEKNEKRFAYVDVLTVPEVLSERTQKINSKAWDGYKLKVEEAKESFLTRLQKERLENAHENPIKLVNGLESAKTSKEIDSEVSVKTNHGLCKFEGIKNYENKNIAGSPKKVNNVKVLDEHEVLSRFESFNDVWKDNDDEVETKKLHKTKSIIPTIQQCEKKQENFTSSNKVNLSNDQVNKNPASSNKSKNLTKQQKSALDDERRKKSMINSIQVRQKQKSVVKSALSLLDSKATLNKKVIFSDDSDHVEEEEEKTNDHIVGKKLLFDGNDDDNEEYEVSIKEQFEGQKGQKLLALQSKYNNDERFKLDSRFADDAGNDNIETPDKGIEPSEPDEKSIQLKVLEDVLGKSVSTIKKRYHEKEMVRYDPTNNEHSNLHDNLADNQPSKKRSKKEEIRLDIEKRRELRKIEENNAVVVSKEKFYKVSDSLQLKGNEVTSGFSLLQMLGRDNEIEEQHPEENTVLKTIPKVIRTGHKAENHTLNLGFRKESFFFKTDDPRFKEGLDFINKKDSEEARAAAENFDVKRKELREVFRMMAKKQLKRKNPFKKKIGGRKPGSKNYNYKKNRK